MVGQIELLLWLALATASIAFTITKTQTFDFVRDRLPDGIFFELMNCPYCMAHYIAAGFVAVYQPMPFSGRWWDLVPATFIVITLATWCVQAILLAARILNVLKKYES